jgi:hypothetical protein
MSICAVESTLSGAITSTICHSARIIQAPLLRNIIDLETFCFGRGMAWCIFATEFVSRFLTGHQTGKGVYPSAGGWQSLAEKSFGHTPNSSQ